jgi:hypothetical protein
MDKLTLLVKASGSKQLQLIDDRLKVEFKNLDLEFDVSTNPSSKWVQVSLSGEDEVVAKSYISREIGICPTNLKNIDKSFVLKGYITKVDSTRQELKVDVGIFEPKIIQASIPVANLQAKLAEGKDFDLKKISELFGLHENLPLSIKLADVAVLENEALPAELSTEQVEKFHLWRQSLLDRLIILGSSRGEIEEVLERTKLKRDVIDVEVLGIFEHALTCKLGTDATGLIPRIGRYMKYATFIVFTPKKLLAFLSLNCH